MVASEAESSKFTALPEVIARNPNFEFQPLAVETLGVLSPSGVAHLKKIVRKLAERQQIPVTEATEAVFQRLSVTLQSENAKMLFRSSLDDDFLIF